MGRSLKRASKKLMILLTSRQLMVDFYHDDDFYGLWGYENSQDPTGSQSITRYVTTVSDCPVLWLRKMETETALLTMEAEYVALSMIIKELLPEFWLINGVANAVGMDSEKTSKIHIFVH